MGKKRSRKRANYAVYAHTRESIGLKREEIGVPPRRSDDGVEVGDGGPGDASVAPFV